MTSPIEFVQRPLGPGNVRITGGFVGKRSQANVDGSLKRLDIESFVGMLEKQSHKEWWWIGEQPGKWLESSVLACATGADDAFAARLREMLARMIAAQSVDGYLGITDPSVRTPEKPLRGMDPYEQYFTFHGLLTAYEVLKDPAALRAAAGLADYYLRYIGPGRAEFWPSPVRPPENRNTIICKQWTWVPPGTPQTPELYWHSEIAGHTAHYSWEGTLVIDPILRLYELTGETRYLDFAKWVVDSIDTWSGWDAFSRLDDVAGHTAGIHQMQPYVHAHTFHMNFLGFLRLYRITGDETLLRKVSGAWDDIAARQLYVTGGVSAGEHYKPGYERPLTGEVVETCANMSWMQLTQQLLQLTGDPKYADVMERLLVNHVFASQTVDGDSYRYHTPPNGQKPSKYFHGPDCCTSSGHRLVAMLPEFIYAQAADAVIVNQYVPSQGTFDLSGAGAVTLTQRTNYPESDSVSVAVSVSGATEFTLMLRIPGWCADATVRVGGEVAVSVEAGKYFAIRRRWSDGDTVELRLPMRTTWETHDHLPVGEERFALARGPVVYAVDTVWWDDAAIQPPVNVDDTLFVPVNDELKTEAVPLEPGHLGPGLRASLRTADGKTVRPMFVPFANVGCWYKDASAKPDVNSAAFSYAVWLKPANT